LLLKVSGRQFMPVWI